MKRFGTFPFPVGLNFEAFPNLAMWLTLAEDVSTSEWLDIDVLTYAVIYWAEVLNEFDVYPDSRISSLC